MSQRTSSAGAGSSKTFETILAGRKCYRVSKDKNEVVWPPNLEAALIEGLEKYTPAESKSPRGLSRFPNRNKFIAQYILQKTGQIRTAKQVGSRIQQLRDTSAGKNIMKAISDRHYELMHPTRPSLSEQHGAPGYGPAVTVSADGSSALAPSIPPVVQVYISVPPVPASPPSTATWPPAPSSRRTEVNVVPGIYQFVEPRTLRTIDPTVTFASSSPLSLYSRCNVYRGDTIVHVGHPCIMNVQASDEQGTGGYLHFTRLAPDYWSTLCNCDVEDLSPYTIVQEITRESKDAVQKSVTAMTIQYQFIQASSGQSQPLSPFTLTQDFDYDGDSGSDVFPLFTGQALSTGSESPLPSDRSSSPSHSIPAGFSSQPLSPVDWASAHNPMSWMPMNPASSTHMPQFPTTYYGMQPQPPVHHQPYPPQAHHQQPPPGQFYSPSSF
ncbi:hypothetical protein C8Q78DRAFT_986295 [Trametes maxima]|nr:hypothetical protein C8Q78DRAFT_986295 [Trametes maxima]